MLLDRRTRRIKKAISVWSRKRIPIHKRRRALADLLEVDFGCKYLGGGCYAHVFALDENRVLKILKNVDEGYERFVRKARRSWSPWLPRIHYSGKWGTARVFILERLETDENKASEIASAINYLSEHGLDSPWLVCPDEGLKSVIEYLIENDCCNDIHDGNIMFRGGQPVITDPCT